MYDDNVGAKAALEANQIDAAVFDLPTALFVSAVEIEGSAVIGQFPADSGGTTDQFGMVLEKDSPLTPCVDAAITTITDDGTSTRSRPSGSPTTPVRPSSPSDGGPRHDVEE